MRSGPGEQTLAVMPFTVCLSQCLSRCELEGGGRKRGSFRTTAVQGMLRYSATERGCRARLLWNRCEQNCEYMCHIKWWAPLNLPVLHATPEPRFFHNFTQFVYVVCFDCPPWGCMGFAAAAMPPQEATLSGTAPHCYAASCTAEPLDVKN